MTTRRVILWVAIGLLIVAGILVYFNFDPSNPALSKFFPKCIILQLTGFKCPGCGSQRAIHDLLNGDIALAATHNALLIAAIPIIILYFIADLIKARHPRLDNVLSHPVAIGMLIVIVIAWWILRNVFNC